MNVALACLTFIIGSVFGSFYNVLAMRSAKNKAFVFGRSSCPCCKKTLVWYELIPIISYLIQKGRCRQCDYKISYIYPLVEITTAFVFFISFLIFKLTWVMLLSNILLSVLIVMVIFDMYYYKEKHRH